MVDWNPVDQTRILIASKFGRIYRRYMYARNATKKRKQKNPTEFPGEKERWLNERWLTATPRDSKVLQMFERAIYQHSYLEAGWNRELKERRGKIIKLHHPPPVSVYSSREPSRPRFFAWPSSTFPPFFFFFLSSVQSVSKRNSKENRIMVISGL